MHAHGKIKRKVCFIGDSSSIHFRKWVSYFVKRGYDVHCISCSKRDIDGANMNYIGYGLGQLDYILGMLKVRSIVKKIKPDIIHVHYIAGYGMLSLLLLAGDIPLVATAWGSDVLIAPNESFLKRQVVRAVLKRAVHLIAVSKHLKQAMIRLGANSDKISVLPIGVDTSLFYPLECKKSDKLQLISLNAHEPVYNMAIVIEAINEVVKQKKEIRVIILGQGSDTKLLKAMVSKFGLSEYVLFTGRVTVEELVYLLQTSNAYISMASSAGTPVSMLEAMSCGVFPIVSEIPGHIDWIESGFNGELIPVNSVHSLTKSLLKMTESNMDLLEIGKYNRKLVLEKADWSVCMLEAEKIYEDIIKKIDNQGK